MDALTLLRLDESNMDVNLGMSEAMVEGELRRGEAQSKLLSGLHWWPVCSLGALVTTS